MTFLAASRALKPQVFVIICFSVVGWVICPGYSLAQTDRTLVLAGGIEPDKNHFSQYLQVKTLAEWLRARSGGEGLDLFFGAGNNERTSSPVPDVSVARTLDGIEELHREVGRLPGNRAATLPALQAYFRDFQTKPVDRLFLFVSDHGAETTDGQEEGTDNRILLWSTDPATGKELPESQRALSRSQLAAILTKVSPRRTIYVMSQCYSGGFHELAVLRSGRYPSIRPGVCGFTASMPETLASGCTPRVDGDGYEGYERYFTEELTGLDCVRGTRRPGGEAGSIRLAHYAARLRDFTLDLPTSSSEYLLHRWAKTIAAPGFVPRNPGFTAEQAREAMKSGRLDPRFAGLLAQAEKAIRVVAMHPDLRGFEIGYPTQKGTLVEIRERIRQQATQSGENADRLLERFWGIRLHTLLPAWKTAVYQGAVEGFTRDELTHFEAKLLAIEISPDHAKQGALTGMVLGSVFRRMRLDLEAQDRQRGHEFAVYLDRRFKRILAWASRDPDPRLRDAANQLSELQRLLDASDDAEAVATRQEQLLTRVELIQEQIAAARALTQMGDELAIRDFVSLEECEREES